MFGRHQLSLCLFTTMLGKPIFRMSRDHLRDRPTTIFPEARSTTMAHRSRGLRVVSFLEVGSLVWSVTNKCVNRVCKEPTGWKTILKDLVMINPSQH